MSKTWKFQPIMSDQGDDLNDDKGNGLVVAPAKPRLKHPPMYKVVMLNDDYTPMEFVIQVLQTFFGMDREKATQVMLHVHTRGVGVCGVFTREIAETKQKDLNAASVEAAMEMVAGTARSMGIEVQK